MGFLILPFTVPFVIVLSVLMLQHYTNYLSPKLSLSSPHPLLRMTKSSGKFPLLEIVSSALLQSWSNFFYTISRNLHKTIQKYENIFPKKCTVNSKDRPKGISYTTTSPTQLLVVVPILMGEVDLQRMSGGAIGLLDRISQVVTAAKLKLAARQGAEETI